jgi:hypothetical protein
MTVKEIIKQYLKANGYDGLVSDDGDCGCELEDVWPCCEGPVEMDCVAGHKVKPDDEGVAWGYSADWVMRKGKRP